MKRNNGLIFKVCPRLISIDGPDGIGKSILAEALTDELQRIFGRDRAKLVRPTYFSTSVKAQRIGNWLEKIKNEMEKYSQLHNSLFLKAMEINYEDVVLPATQAERLVILDSSEIRALAFILDKGDKGAIKDTIMRIKTGVLTSGIQPKMRIILRSKKSDLWKNLLSKNNLDEGDPQSIQEIEKRIVVYQKAIELIRQLEVNDEVKWVTINVKHVVRLSEYLSGLVSQIIPQLMELGTNLIFTPEKTVHSF